MGTLLPYASSDATQIHGHNIPAPGAGEDEKGFVYDHDTGAFVWTDFATQAELNTHKSSSDHDGRYYTESEVDALLSTNATNDRNRANHTGSQAATTVSYAGGTGMSATNVETAIDELANEKINYSEGVFEAWMSADLSSANTVVSAHTALGGSSSSPAITWTEIADTSNYFNPATGKYTPTVAGWYEFNFHLYVDPTVDGQYAIGALWRNGAIYLQAVIARVSGVNAQGFCGTVIADTDGNDEFQMGYYVDATSSIALHTRFMAKRI